MIQRFNQTFNNMLVHVIQQCGRQWHTFIPFMTWAMREVASSTTNVSPFALVCRRTPRGPLAVLKESWTGERDVTMNVSKSVSEYLDDLKQRLRSIAELAANYASPGKNATGQNAPDKMPLDKMPPDKMPQDKMPLDKMLPTVEFVFIYFKCCFHLLPYHLTCRNRL